MTYRVNYRANTNTKSLCKRGITCQVSKCGYTHPPERREECQDESCKGPSFCKLIHAQCKLGVNCDVDDCPNHHPPTCYDGRECTDRKNCAYRHVNNPNVCKTKDCHECKLDHPQPLKDCFNGRECKVYECIFSHPIDRAPKCRQKNCPGSHACGNLHQKCKYDRECNNSACPYHHTKGFCRYGMQCHKKGSRCPFRHVVDINKCWNPDCGEAGCNLKHPNPCDNAKICRNAICVYAHRGIQRVLCEAGKECDVNCCEKWHPDQCVNGVKCTNLWCKRFHPKGRADECDGVECPPECEKLHPPSCHDDEECRHYFCIYWHPTGRSTPPCKYGIKCKNPKNCGCSHPPNSKRS